MRARAALLVALGAIFAGCTVFPTEHDEMKFQYTAFGGDDHFDQVLEITNDGLTSVVPHLELTPLDGAGQPLPDVTVTTAFGSERGKRVIPSYFTDYDVLKFEGPEASEVEDVRVRIIKLEQVTYPSMPEGAVTVQRFDDDIRVPDDQPFDAIELTNPNDDALTVGMVLIAWLEPRRGEPQQFDWAIPHDDIVTVPANGTKMVPMPEGFADTVIVSVDTFSALHPEDAVSNVGEWRVRAGRKREP